MAWIVQFFHDPIARLHAMQERTGPVLVLSRLLPRRKRQHHRSYIVALGAEYNRIVLGDPAAFRTTGQTLRGQANSALSRVRYGLTAMNGAKHRQQRQLIAPFFSKKAIDSYHAALLELAEQTIAEWPSGRVVDFTELVHLLTLRLSAKVLFGREDPERMEGIGLAMHRAIRLSMSPVLQLFPFRFPGSPMAHLMGQAEKMEALLTEMIHRRRAQPPTNDGDMLDHLVHARDADDSQLTDTDLIGQTTILFGASYETQAKALTWTALLLAQHSRVQRLVLEELEAVLKGRPPTVEQLEQLPYLDAVVKESMRLLPPVPYGLRRATTSVDLNGIPVESGDWIIFSHYMTHRLSEVYDQPRRFLPERWFTIKPTQYEYLPFSAGPRWCIGKPLAMTMMKLVLTTALQRWRWRVQPGARIDRLVRVTMSPRRGLPVTLHPQDGQCRPAPLRGNVIDMVDWSDKAPAHELVAA